MSFGEGAFNLSLTTEDVASIQRAARLWGKPQEVVEHYGEVALRRHFKCWEKFVHASWDEDWYPEYDHDIGCRYWIQLAVEYATPETRDRLQEAVKPLDDLFKQRMRPCPLHERASLGPFLGRPYFWETNTIL